MMSNQERQENKSLFAYLKSLNEDDHITIINEDMMFQSYNNSRVFYYKYGHKLGEQRVIRASPLSALVIPDEF